MRASPFKPVFVNLTRCWPGLRSLANHYVYGLVSTKRPVNIFANSRWESQDEE